MQELNRMLERIAELGAQLDSLKQRNQELVLELMQRSKEASEAREELIRFRSEIDICADQHGHNLCWWDAVNILRNARGGRLEEPYFGVPPENEFLLGCIGFRASLSGDRLDPARVRPGVYRHYKGSDYLVFGSALDANTGEEMLFYRSYLGGGGCIWVRPRKEFFEEIEKEGYKGPRFRPVRQF